MTLRVPQLVISKTRSVSPARKLRSVAGFSHISSREMCHARPALHTVFSTTQLGHLIEILRIYITAKIGMICILYKRNTFIYYSAKLLGKGEQ